nr:unnamed protein product [Digitaria exilis]
MSTVSAGGHGGGGYGDGEEGQQSIDFRGNPVDKSRTGGWLGAGLILGTELAERVCVMGISMNLVTYLVGELHLSNSKSATVCVPASGGQLAMLYAALYTIAAGAGGLKANVSGFGSDQFDGRDPREEHAMVFFFNRFYFCVSLGSLFAVTVLVYVQDHVGRGWGYGVSAVAMVLAVAVFVAGTPKYRYRRPQGSPLTVIGRVLATAWRKRRLTLPADAAELHGFHAAKVAHTDRLRCLDKAAIVEADLSSTAEKQQPAAATVTEVEEVKMVVKLLPIWSTCILFWTVYSQMTTFSVEQATRMDRTLRHGGGFAIPAGSLSVFLFLSILLFTSLNERVLVPLAARLTGRSQGLTSLQRVGAGLALSVAAMAVAALVERKRRDASTMAGGVPISAFWLVPQYFLVGAGEAFAYVGQLEFFIREAPERMKSMSTGLFLVTLSMGFFLSSFLVFAVDGATRGSWIRNNLDRGKLDLFYWMLAVLGVANFAVFLVFAGRHQYKASGVAAAVAPGENNKEMDDFVAVKEAVEGMDV